MTTPNEELILKLRGQAYTTCRPDQLCDQAADLLQSQAERIKVIERESEMRRLALHDVMLESDQLRAELAAIAANEPVGKVEISHDINDAFMRSLPIGTQLFTRPMPAQGVTELVDAAYDEVQRQIVERYRVEKSIGGFWPCCVKAGDGTMDIFVGSKKQAEHVRQALQTACLDGAFMTSKAALSKYKGAK